MLKALKLGFSKRFGIASRETRICLSIKIVRNRQERTLKISQAYYALNILDRFGMLRSMSLLQ